jgi:hypothetical protein
VSEIILAAQYWNNNSELIADCARLGYLDKDWLTLDPTYGKGNWWNEFRPNELVTHDIAIDGVDFRRLPYPDNHFDVVAYDPPYVSVGGRQTTGIKEFYSSYGLEEAPHTPRGLQMYINMGLAEAFRVVKPKGFILVKCQDYISSGKLWIGTFYTQEYALVLGLHTEDRFEFITKSSRPQPAGRRQVHARRNVSTLFVFKKA